MALDSQLRLAKIANDDLSPRSPQGKIIRSPSTRIQTVWTPQLIKAAERQAEAGNLSLAASVIEGLLLSDDRIRGCLSTRVQGLFSLPVEFEAAGDRRRSSQAVKSLEAGEDYWACFPEAELVLIKSWAILLGVGPGINRWTTHDGRAVPNLHFWSPGSLVFDFRRDGWFTRTLDNEEIQVTPGDGTWFLHTPYGSHRPWLMGLWRALAPWALLKAYARDDWGRHSEAGVSTVITETSDSASKELRQELADSIHEAGKDPIIVLPPGFDIKSVEKVANSQALYGVQVDAANLAFAIAIKGSNLTTEVQGGSFAATSVHRQVDLVFLRADDESLAADLHDQELVHYANHNFGSETLAPWPFHQIDPPEDRAAAAAVSLQASDLLDKLEKQGFELDEKAWADRFGLGQIIKGRKAVEDRPLPPAPPGPPGAPLPGQAGEPPTKAKAAPKAVAKATTGHIDGQVYVDEVVDRAKTAKAAKPDLTKLTSIIDGAEDYESLRAALAEYLGADADPSDLSDLLAQSLILSELAGRLAVRVDVPELE